jgi:hypothetical protein
MTTRLPLTQEQKIQKQLVSVAKFNARLDAEVMPEGFTVGYIGNCSRDLDDRSWMIFRDHAGRVGTKEDRMGGYSTEERYKLLTIIKAIKFTLNA